MANPSKREEHLTGDVKAAVLISLLPDNVRKTVMHNLEKDEKIVIGKVVKEQIDQSDEDVQAVLLEYITYMQETSLAGRMGGPEYLYNLFKDTMSDDELDEFITRIMKDERTPFEKIKKLADIKPLITILQKEDPQTIAIVATYLKPIQAAQLMQALPPEKMQKVAFAIAQLDQPNQEVLLELESEITKMMNLFVPEQQRQTDGIKTLVDIINNVPRSAEKTIFGYLDDVNKPLSEQVRDRLFMFEDIAKLEVRDVMTIVNEISEDVVIAKALRGAPEEIKYLFNNAMSEGRRARVDDADAVIGKIKLQDAEEAQQEVSNVAKQLEKDGKITISRGEDDVIL